MLRKGCKYPSSYVKPPSTHPVLMLNPGQGSYASEERQEPGSPLSCHLPRGRGRFSLPEHPKSLASPGRGNNAWQQGDGGGAPLQAQPPFSVSLNLQTFLSSYPEIRFNVKPTPIFFFKAGCAKTQEKQTLNKTTKSQNQSH